MKACKHYGYYGGEEVYIVPSEGFLWNAWKHSYDDKGNLVGSEFRSGLMWEYLEHLSKNPKCRKEVKISSRYLKSQLEEIKKEWEVMLK